MERIHKIEGVFPKLPADEKIPKAVLAICDALLELLRTKPLEQIYVKDICRIADINRSTFYEYYTDKYELFEKSMRFMLTAIEKNIDFRDSKNGYRNSISLFRLVKEYKFLFEKALITDTTGEARKILHDLAAQDLMNKVGMLFINCDRTDKRIIFANYYAGAVLSIIEWWIRAKCQISEDTMARYLVELMTVQAPCPDTF